MRASAPAATIAGKSGYPGRIPYDSSASFHATDTGFLVSLKHDLVLQLFYSLRETPVNGIVNLHPAYGSLLIRFDPLSVSHERLEAEVQKRLESVKQAPQSTPRTISIPVCYCGEFAPDLARVAQLHGLSEQDVVDLHSHCLYTVYFLGFVPGFAYLGTVPELLRTPRLPSPRKKVPPGSLGIADLQTGIYPACTPGGWNLIGRTPAALFCPTRAAMSLLEPGDQVRFHPISRRQFEAFPNE